VIAQAPADMWRKLRRSMRLLSELLIALGILPFPHTKECALAGDWPIDLPGLAICVFFGGPGPRIGSAASIRFTNSQRLKVRLPFMSAAKNVQREDSQITGAQRDGNPDVP